MKRFRHIVTVLVVCHLTLLTMGASKTPYVAGPGQTRPAAVQASPLDVDVDFEKMLAEFEQGDGVAHVVVYLEQPKTESQNIDWDDAKAMASLHRATRALSDQVIRAAGFDEVKAEHLYENFAGFSAYVSLEGFEALLNDPLVKQIKPVTILYPQLAQGVPLMNALTSRATYDGSGVSIAICDQGIDPTHPMLGNGPMPNGKVIGGYDFGGNDADPSPTGDMAHGVACAGIAAGNVGSVGDYIGGVAPGAKLYNLKISNDVDGSASDADMIAAWDWCLTHRNDDPSNPIQVVSTSFGGGEYSATCDGESAGMTTAANNLAGAGVVVCASSGNDGLCAGMGWPACITSVWSIGAVYDANFGQNPGPGYVGCISANSCVGYTAGCPCPGKCYVDSTTAPDQVCTYSNSATFLDFFGASNKCYTTDIVGANGYSTGDYADSFGGTSAACPYVAGCVAAFQSAAKAIKGNFYSVAQVKSAFESTGVSITDPKASPAVTKKRPDLGAAIAALGPAPTGSPTASASPSASPSPSPTPSPVATPFVEQQYDIKYRDRRDRNLTHQVVNNQIMLPQGGYGTLKIKKKRNVTNFDTIPAVIAPGTVLNLWTEGTIALVDVNGELKKFVSKGAHAERIQAAGYARKIAMKDYAQGQGMGEDFVTSIYSGPGVARGLKAHGGPPSIKTKLLGVNLYEFKAPYQQAWVKLAAKKWKTPSGGKDVSEAAVIRGTANVVEAGDLRKLQTKGNWINPNGIVDHGMASKNAVIMARGQLFSKLLNNPDNWVFYFGSVYGDYIHSGAGRLKVMGKGGWVYPDSEILASNQITAIIAKVGRYPLGFLGGAVVCPLIQAGSPVPRGASASGTVGLAGVPGPDIKKIQADAGVNWYPSATFYDSFQIVAGNSCDGDIKQIKTKPIGNRRLPQDVIDAGGPYICGTPSSANEPRLKGGDTAYWNPNTCP